MTRRAILSYNTAMDGETRHGGFRPPAEDPPGTPAGKGRILRWLGIAIVAVIVFAIVASFMLPRHVTVARSTLIAAPASQVYALVSDLRRFNEWSPWADIDPEAVYTFTGPADGVGQTLNWESGDERLGDGSLSISGLEPDARVDLTMAFIDAGEARTSVQLVPDIDGTRVSWGFESDLGFNPIARYFGVLADGIVGPDYEKGLARLKTLAETPPPPPPGEE